MRFGRVIPARSRRGTWPTAFSPPRRAADHASATTTTPKKKSGNRTMHVCAYVLYPWLALVVYLALLLIVDA